MEIFSNLFYFKSLNKLGGTEQFLYEIAKKYNIYDCAIFYDSADSNQLQRLRKYFRCIKRTVGEKVYCQRAFFNFNIDMIDDIESLENYYCFISHAIYQELGYQPPITHSKLNHFFGVSKYSCDKLLEFAKLVNREINVDLVYNPLTIEKPIRIVKIICASRLGTDKTKGGDRIIKFIKACDEYCKIHNTKYLMTIFTDYLEVDSENVVFMKPRTDVRNYIADADYLIQLSNDMETYCYSINEALSYGTKVITTPLTVLNEFDIPKNMQLICEFDMSNVNDVIQKMFEIVDEKTDEYKPPLDGWNNYLVKNKTKYIGEMKMKIKVLKDFDITGTNISKHIGEIFDTDDVFTEARAMNAVKAGYAEVIDVVPVTANEITHVEEVVIGETYVEKPKKKTKKTKNEKV